jgi:hypothetical protein
MTIERDDDRAKTYLWDPATADAADADVQALERQLAPLRFDPQARPLRLPARLPRRQPRTLWIGLAAAAVLLLTLSAGFWQWRGAWPAGRAWTVSTRPASAPSALAVGAPLTVSPGDSLLIDVARIGTMRVEGGSRLTLRSTQSNRHRLALDTGRVHLRVWAPPTSVAILTPVGEVIDMGCEFELDVEASIARLHVRSGWVQLDNALDESLIPAGASGEMTKGMPPTVPVFDTADPRFLAAVRSLERSGDTASLDTVVQTARVEDVLTLIMLVERGTPGSDRLASRAAELWPLPSGVTVGAIVRGDRVALERWLH